MPRSTARLGFPREGGRATLAALALVYLEPLAFGADRLGVALSVAVLQGFSLLFLLSTSWGQAALRRFKPHPALPILLALVVGIALLGLTPLSPGGAHPAWAFVGVHGGAALNPLGVVTELVKLGGYVCVFLAGMLLAADRERARLLFRGLVAGGLAFCLLALVLFAVSRSTVFGVPKPAITVGRLSAAFSSANTAATFFGMVAVLAAAGLLQRQREGLEGRTMRASQAFQHLLSEAALELSALVAAATCLVLSASRAGLAACGVGVLALVVWNGLAGRGGGKPRGVSLVIVFAPLLALAASSSLLMQRTLTPAHENDDRLVWLGEHWKAFLAAPWMGYGLGSFQEVNRLISTRQTFAVLAAAGGAAHNVVVQWLEQAGVLGAAPMFVLVGWVLFDVTAGSVKRRHLQVWMRGVVAASLVILLHSLTDYALEEPAIAAFWSFLLGAGWTVAQRREP